MASPLALARVVALKTVALQPLVGRVSCASSRSILPSNARALTDFAYVRPGPVPTMRHKVRWRESERNEVWKHDTIPWVDPSMPLASRGNAANFWEATMKDVEGSLERLQDAQKDSYLVVAMKEALSRRGGAGILSDAEWQAISGDRTADEAKLVVTAEARRATLLQLFEEAQALLVSIDALELDAKDSGEIDLSVPVPETTREALQATSSKKVLLQALQLARKLSLITSAMDVDMSPKDRAVLRNTLDNASSGIEYTRLKALDVHSGDPAHDVRNREETPLQKANANHFATYEEERQDYFAHRDRTEVVPRRKLPTPLHADAPTRQLEDVARVIDSNPSFSEADKRYILQNYTDAVTGKTDKAFDWSAEKKAIVDPQPQWSTYDPKLVTLQDDFVDAAMGQGKFSKMRGYTVGSERISPRDVGEIDANPSRKPLEAGEEVSQAIAAYDRDTKAKMAKITESITAAVSASMGISPKAFRAGFGPSKPAKVPEAAKEQPAKEPAMKGVSKPAGLTEEDAAKVVKSFFKRYLAGERVPTPTPPMDGPRKEPIPVAAAAPEKAKGKAKGKK